MFQDFSNLGYLISLRLAGLILQVDDCSIKVEQDMAPFSLATDCSEPREQIAEIAKSKVVIRRAAQNSLEQFLGLAHGLVFGFGRLPCGINRFSTKTLHRRLPVEIEADEMREVRVEYQVSLVSEMAGSDFRVLDDQDAWTSDIPMGSPRSSVERESTLVELDLFRASRPARRVFP